MLTFESASVAGAAGIVEKLVVLPSGTPLPKQLLIRNCATEPSIQPSQACRVNTRCPTFRRDWRNFDLGYWSALGELRLNSAITSKE